MCAPPTAQGVPVTVSRAESRHDTEEAMTPTREVLPVSPQEAWGDPSRAVTYWKTGEKYAAPDFPLPLHLHLRVSRSALPSTWVISVRGSSSTLKGSPQLKVWILPHCECQVLHVNKNSLEILSVRTMQSSKCLYYDCHRQELIYLLFSSTFLSLTCIFCSVNIG